jgi:hypothetical protein
MNTHYSTLTVQHAGDRRCVQLIWHSISGLAVVIPSGRSVLEAASGAHSLATSFTDKLLLHPAFVL